MVANPAIACLRAKVGRNGPDPKLLITQAEEAVAGLTASFHEWAQRDLSALEEQLEGYAKDGEGGGEAVRGMHRIAHDIKGQGGSFGYPLLTTISASLSGYLEGGNPEGGIDPRIVRAHIDAMKVVIRDRIEGDGGKIGARLTDELFALVDRALAQRGKLLVST
jgi:HPt (histidine-containing phosphotransfer) domain-containing protein